MLYRTIPAFEDYVHKESCILLSNKECACCGTDMKDRPYGMIGVSVSFKPAPDATRHYFPLYHLVCRTCFDLVYYWQGPERLNAKNQPNQPEWSEIWSLSLEHRPYALASLDDEDSLTDLFFTMADATSSWEEFSEVTNCETMAAFLGLS
jgi:muconolactone delta-isomerase